MSLPCILSLCDRLSDPNLLSLDFWVDGRADIHTVLQSDTQRHTYRTKSNAFLRFILRVCVTSNQGRELCGRRLSQLVTVQQILKACLRIESWLKATGIVAKGAIVLMPVTTFCFSSLLSKHHDLDKSFNFRWNKWQRSKAWLVFSNCPPLFADIRKINNCDRKITSIPKCYDIVNKVYKPNLIKFYFLSRIRNKIKKQISLKNNENYSLTIP